MMKKLLFHFASFEPMQEIKPKMHYLQARLMRLQKLAQFARNDKNILKAIQAHRLINDLQKNISVKSSIKLPYIN